MNETAASVEQVLDDLEQGQLRGTYKANKLHSMVGMPMPRYDLVNRVMTFGLDVRWRRRALRDLDTNGVAVQDVGFAINPAEVEAQIHGGVAQGLGWALYEGMIYDGEGQLLTATLMDYALPRAQMVPPIETVLVEVPSEHGAYGAKGIGEPPAIPGAAAVANAQRAGLASPVSVMLTTTPARPGL